MGYWLVLPYSAIRGHPSLKIAPVGVVPQRERRPRPIMDYSYNGVNQASIPLAPLSAMQFGTALQRILQRIAYCNPSFGPPHLVKIDLANGYYRVPLSPEAALQLAVCLPPDNSGEALLGIPLSLPMGWSLSPPYFCAFTETCADLTNSYQPCHPEHPYFNVTTRQQQNDLHEAFSHTAQFPYNPHQPEHPLSYNDVYIDDFMLVAQRPNHLPLMDTLLHHLHSIFRDPLGSPRRAVISESKVNKGEATFETRKTILGWDLNTQTMTMHLPPHRVQRLSALLHSALASTYTTRKKWQRLLGELHNMVPALHSAKYLFSVLHQHLVDHQHRCHRLTALPRQALIDWLHMLNNLGSTPVPIAYLVPQAPHVLAATDASRDGMGGFWLPTCLKPGDVPFAWRYKWPDSIKNHLVSFDNPSGDLSINNLELAAIVTAFGTQLYFTPDLHNHAHLCCATDNTAAQAWVAKGSPTTSKAPAHLLRLLAHDCRRLNVSIQAVFRPGFSNSVAELLSRLFSLSDASLLDALTKLAPLQRPWQLVTPPANLISNVNWALSSRLPPQALQLPNKALTTPPGPSGHTSVMTLPVIHSYKTSRNHFPSYRYLLIDTAWEQWLPLALQSKLEQWNKPFAQWARRSPHWATEIPGCKLLDLASLTSDCIANCKHTQRPTRHLPVSSPSHSKSSNMLFNNATPPLMLGTKPLATWSPLVSSSYYDQVNMHTLTTRTQPRSVYKTFTSSATDCDSTFSPAPNTTSTPLPTSHLNSLRKRMVSGVN